MAAKPKLAEVGSMEGHNSNAEMTAFLQGMLKRYAAADQISAEQNDERAAIRAELKERGINPQAFVAEYKAAKPSKSRAEKEGYTESVAACRVAFQGLESLELFSYWINKEAEKSKARSEKKASAESTEAA